MPEKRLNIKGHLVTKHVRSGSSPAPLRSLPAPSIASPEQPPAPLAKARTEQLTRTVDMHRKYADSKLKAICVDLDYRTYGTTEFTASDVEIYDVLSAAHGNNAMVMLAVGIRSREAACIFLKAHDLDHLITDHRKITQDALERNIPAFTAMELMGMHGSAKRDEPHYLDALEANGVRTLRELNKYYPTIPDMIMKDQISLDDIKTIGATRLMEAARFAPVVEQLKKIHSGESSYDAQTMKDLLLKGGMKWRIKGTNVLAMANQFGAERMLGLIDIGRAAQWSYNFLRSTTFSDEVKGEIIVFEDKLAHRVQPFERDDVINFYENGVSVQDVKDGLRKDLTITQIVALKNGVKPNLADGWL